MSQPSMDWNERYRAGDAPWDKGRAHPLLSAERLLPEDHAGRILLPGCGRGWDVDEWARQCPRAEIIGVDLSAIALGDAAARFAGRPGIRFITGDFLDPAAMAAAVGPVDVIWEHTCFCAIPPGRRPDYAATAGRLLRPGGLLAGVFFLDLDDGGSGPPWNCPEEELRRWFGADFEVEAPRPIKTTYEGREGEERLVRMIRR
jgi:SAM-dependent methyltransferase